MRTDGTIEPSSGKGRPLGRGHLEAEGFGTLWIAWSEVGLVSIDFVEPPYRDAELAKESEVPGRFADPLTAYFGGEALEPAALPVDLLGTEFQVRVWEALRRVPRGQVRTYAGIATDVGSPRAMRAVGMANAKNPLPIVVPCHRIVEVGHKLGGYSGGLDRKRFLLRLEGVRVEEDLVLPGQLTLF